MSKTAKTNWKPTDNRFVAFLDILGFKDLISKKSHAEIYDKLNTISKTKNLLEDVPENIINHNYKDAEIYIVSFSDSIIVFSKNDSLENFQYFLVSVRYLFAKTVAAGIPLKGGIAVGEISVNKSEQIYFGQAIIDAYLMEEDVNYIGVVCNYSIDNYIKNSKINNLLFEQKTPLKCGLLNHYNLDWFKIMIGTKNELNEKEKYDNIIQLINNFKISASGAPRKYIDNTVEFIEKSKGILFPELK